MKDSITEILNDPSYKLYVTAFISLFIFITGGIIKYSFSQFRAYQKRRSLRNIIRILLINTIKELKSSELHMYEFCKTVSVKHNASWNLIHKQLTYLNTFYEFSFSETYNAFQKKRQWQIGIKNKELAFHKFWALLRVLTFTENQIESNLKLMVDKHNEYHNKYKDSLSQFRLNFDHLMIEVNGKKIPNEISKDLADYLGKQDLIWHKWEQQGEETRMNYYRTYSTVVKPSLELLRENSMLKITKVFDKDLLDCTHQFMQMEGLLNSYKNQFYSHYLNYRTARRKLVVIVRILK